MSNQTLKLIELLNEGKSCNEICSILNISNKQLYSDIINLKNKGLYYQKKYYSTGDIIYQPINNLKDLNQYLLSQETSIITSPKTNELRCLVISDLHLGHPQERLDLIKIAYDYCQQKDIHIIFCCGDMIEGTFENDNPNIENIYNQIDHLIKDYPSDKNILTFCVAGNHELECLNQGFQDVREIIKNYRHDIIMESYGNAVINIKNEKILLTHPIPQSKHHIIDKKGIHDINKKGIIIQLNGHSHKYSVKTLHTGKISINIPALSDKSLTIPSMLDLKLLFDRGLVDTIIIKQIIFMDKSYTISEIEVAVPTRIPTQEIKYEECIESSHKLVKQKPKI